MATPPNDKRALLAQMLREKTQKAKQAPMSFAQERMWFLYQWNPTSPAFNMPGAVRMSGDVDTEALRRALQELARRHETLRTTFSDQDGRLVQTIAPTLELPLPVVDLRDVPEAQREQRVREHITAEARRPFDLTRGPLLRASLLRLAEREHVLLLCLHHIIGDGWSQGVFIHEMATLYAAFVRGETSPLKPLPLQYAEFSSWQREWLQGERLETELSWWRERLDANAVLELPTDRPRPSALSPSGARQKVVLPPALSQALKALSQREGKTLFVTLLSAFNVLLHRYSGQADIVVGTPIAGRTRAELEGLIGLFINTLALRTPLSGALPFRELMGQVHHTTVEAFAHQELPFERLVDALKPERRLSHSPLFQVMFILQNAPMPPLRAPGLVMEYQQPETGTAKIDLTLIAAELPEGLRLVVEYSTDLFDATTVSRLLEHYQTLLAGIVANPESPVAHLPLLSEPERRAVLAESNGPAVQYPREACVHELIQAQVERTPEAVALVNGDHSLTYAELNTRANQLAHALRARGVGPDSPVGVCTTRSLDMVVALLGIHKAGGAYVPLDPAYPRERLEYMLRDSGARVLVTQSHVDAPLQPGDCVTRLDVDTLAVAPEGASNPSTRAASDNVAYVIYTSGSTGRPKGVQVPHRTVANFFTAMDAALHRPERGVWLAVTSISFDISVLELLWTLSRGFTVVVQSDTLDADWLPQAVRQHSVTHLQCTPSMARALLLDASSSEALRDLKQMMVGGEAMTPELARELRQRVPSLLNMYGPTETTVWSSTHPVPAEHAGPVPLGAPIANTQLHVLDEHLQPVPLGVSGELYIGGDGVVRGYLGRPELTAERFVPDPFSATSGARLYRTGDRVRRRADGSLDFLGRIDFQVKVRGFRIELGEIESALDKHPGVHQSVVLAREDKPGDPRLVAYLTSSGQEAPTPAELRSYLKQHLPEYMVPSAFVVLEQLPLTPNGKVNRKALPAPEAPADSGAGYIAPRTPTEEKLAALWAEVLEVPRVGAEDNFFELGGHSLLAMRALSRLRATLQVELSVRALFEAPTLCAFALKVDETLEHPAREGSRPPPVRPMPRTGDIPLAFAQQRLWFLDQLEPGNPVYNTPVALRLSGPVDPEALRRAFDELVRRHESLRTTYSSRDGQPLQVIAPSLSLPLEVLEVRDTPASAREARARELIRQEVLRPFELARGPLLRATLLRLTSDDHVLLLVIHHIISDGWSMGVLVRDMASLYAAIAAGQPPSLPPLPIQYADFALWQHKWLQGEVLDSQLRYWKQQLSGAPAHLELPTDKPRPPVQSFRGDLLPVALPRELSESIRALSKRLSVTPFMTLLAGIQVVLHRYTGQDDISVGTSIAGRRGTELEGLVGFLINTLVLRSRLSSKASFRELLLQVRDTTLAAHEHQDVPFEKLVEHLQPQRDLSRTPLFQVMFVLHNAPTETMTLPGGLTLRPQELTNSVSKFDWMLSLADTSGGFTGGLEYSTDLFERDTMARAMEHLRVVLEAAVAQPETPLSELPLLTRAEKHQLLTGFNGPTADYPRDVCLHQLIEAQVERTPDALALTFEGQSLTYRELDSRANQLAWHLRSLGVGPESRVGLCLERSPELVVALLATLKAGGAYVPLDPAYPQERLGWMLEDASPTVLLVQERLLSRLPAQDAHVVCLDSGWDDIASRPSHTPPLQSTANGLAYIIFTSGSTGRPKGAMNEHHPVVNRLLWMQEEYRLGAEDVVLQKTPFSFDVSVWEFFWPLMQGARLVLAKPGGHQDPNYLASLIAQERVTTLHFVPSMLKVFLEEPNLEQRCVSLRRVVCSGEALPVEFQDQCLQRLPHAELHNLYGPTEAAVDVTYYACKPGQSLRSVPIGRPVANTQIHILDARLQPVPVGVHGELYIGGVQVGRGYRARPNLTAERFIPDPFSSTPGARMYRTGDVARWLPDGNIEYMGRADFQVKIRGLRIELGEIEAHLAQHPAVRQVVVVAREDRPGDKRLVAYVVAPPEQASAAELRAFLQPRLPEHMVPSAFVCLEQFPLSPNGKLERRALPAPEATTSAAGYIAPRTSTEEKLAAIWAKVLSVPRVGAEDHFFELGGHSLLATQVISRLRSTFQVELPVRAFFEATTLSALARKVDEALERQARNAPQTPALRPVPRTGDLPLSFSQQRLWFLDQLEPGSSVYNMPVALRFSGKADPEALRRALDELVRRHESLRTTFTSRNGEPAQLILPSLTLPLEVMDLQDVPASEREARAQELARQEAQRPFDLARGPLLRAALLRLGADDHVLLVTMHHIVSDGWSMGVLVREVASLYAAFASGQQPSLPPLPIQYADFAVWQREWLQGEVLDSQLGYWKQQLSGAAHLELATDKPRPPVQTFRGDSLPVVLSKNLSESLKALSTRLGVTPFMTLLAGLQVLLHRYSGQDDISVGSPIAGRRGTELESLIGFFVNTLVLRSRFSPDTSFRGLLEQVRDTTLAAYEHQDVPFEKLVEQLQPQRDLSRPPFFQVMFVLQNAPAEALRLPDLTLRPLQQSSTTAKFEWTLSLTDMPGGFTGSLEYNTDLFEPGTVARAMEHLRVVLEGAVANPEARLSELPLLSEAEKHTVLAERNDTRVDYPRDSSIHALFEAQAARTPDAIAVEFEGQQLTYRQLDARANQLAHGLRRLGMRPGTPVALCTERSLEMVIATLGILKAGGAYVPLDPAYPRERLDFMLRDVGAPLLLAQRHLAERLPPSEARVVLLDSDFSQESESSPGVHVPAESLAYVMYTSGSTGQPKGVCIPHRGVVRLVMGSRFADFGPGEVMLQLAPISFDASTFELWGSLLHGGKLVVFSPHAPSFEELGLALKQHRITTLWLTAALFDQMVATQSEALSHVRQVLAGGDVLAPERVKARLAHGGLLVNGYGPTESTTFTTCNVLSRQEQVGHSVSIGRPISNTQVYVLDALLRPVPTGVPGELYIGGDGLAWGYLHRPELTAERFVPNPFARDAGERLYRTGDKVRWLADGTLDFLGRLDSQVKLRGFRIELGEVESALDKCPGVRQSVVLAREDRPGDKRLVAYVIPSGQQAPTSAELRSSLKEHLPEYMVPSAFVVLEALPITANGKVDRKALPAPEATVSAAEYIAPRTPTEEKLAALWSEVLGVARVGAEDHFFELGGHSLLATQVISRVRSAFEMELPVRALFEAPTLGELARRIDEVLARETGNAPQTPTLRPVPRTGDLPLAFSQQRLWFLDQLEPGSPVYNVPYALRLSGQPDAEALRHAFEELVRRHESLRTTFTSRDGQPRQVIAPSLDLPLEVMDLQDVPAPKREARARELARQEAQRPFDLTNGPLLRTALLRLGADDHVLLVTLHHIISDGWSMGVLVREVAVFYAAFAAGQQPSLPPLPIQYADFAVWQREWLQGEVLDSQLGYWKQQLSGAAHLELTTDKPRPPVQTVRGDSLPVALPKALSESIKALSTRLGVTPFMTLLAGLQVLLHRYSGQDDISVGSPIAGRRGTELESLIGFFVNTLVLRSRVEPGTTFRELLLQVRDTTLAAYEHQDVPFEKLVEELQPQRDLSRPPFFQVMFVLQNTPAEALRLPGLTLRPMQHSSTTAKFDWTLGLSDMPEGFTGNLEYNTDLFEPGTVARAMVHLRVLLSAVVANPEARLSELPLLSEAEKHTVLTEWNATRVDYPRDSSIHALFEAQAARTPDAIAVEFEGQSLTYRQLDARANQLAHALLRLGMRPGLCVALCAERSLEMVVSTLAILKAGGAYVPLDPAYPRERLEFMLQDVSAPLLLAQRHLAERLPQGHARLVLLDSDFSQESESSPGVHVPAESLAYVMYTSGSTGQPKGVCIPHRGVVRLVMGSRFADFGPGEVMLQLAPISFDASTFELWGSLLHGGKLVVFSPHAPSFEELGLALKRHRITTLWLTAALFDQMVATQSEALSHVRQVLAGGDVLAPERVKARLAHGGLLVNGYGPTESTTFTTCNVLSRQEQVGHSVSIGRPISNTQVYVLDALLRPVPTGVPGELYIGGDGLAWGYLHRPELTAERFVPNPFARDAGERLYRTGDKVRWLADGTLDFLGRLDSQVKLRGFRIELGEVESALDKCPGVRQSVVLAREDRPGDKRLVAYVIPSGQQAPTSAELRSSLKEHLPEYMVPSAFVVLEALPITANGKVDRKALPAPESTASAAEYVAPRTPTEEKLAALWSEVLGVARVGAEDHFFELGGHSLKATQIVSRVRTAFQVELPVRVLFETPTLSALARKLDEPGGRQGLSGPRMTPPSPVSRTAERPLSFAQQRLWFLDQLEPGSPVYNIPAALRLSGQLDVEALRRAFEELVRRHESLRTLFVSSDGQPVQRIAPSIFVSLEVLNLQDVPASEREARARELLHQEAQRPFDLAQGPLVRTSLLRLAPEEHVLVLLMHHIISDGWSMGVLVREVTALYAAFASGQQPALPPLPLQYADFASWQREWLQGEVLDSQLAYWKQQLSGAPSHLELPTDKPRPPVQSHRGAQHTFVLPPSLSAALAATSSQHGVSLFMTLLAGFQVLLHRYTGQDDILVGSPIAGRRNTELESLIGFFVNTLVLRSRFSPETSFRELLQQVRGTTLSAYEHQDVPFEKLVEEVAPERTLGYSPLFQVMFALQNMPIPEVALGGLTLSPLEAEGGVSKFDLSLSMQETPGGLRGTIDYNTDLFERDTVVRMAEHLQVLLSAVVASPGMPVSRLPLLPEAEKHKLLVEWNDLPLDYPRDATIHELFEAQAARTPDAEALVDGTRSLTYAELNARANQLAHSLHELGVGPETPVGICCQRSAELVVGLLGILKAGGLYVPLDPAYPRERLGFILEDAGLRFLVAQSTTRDSLPAHSAHVLLLDSEAEALSRASTLNPARAASSANLAYLIYTSGSTGRPKGVSIEHRNAVSFLFWARTVFTPEMLSGLLASTSIAFDLSVFELFLPLSLGGTVVLAPNALELPRLPAAGRVSLVNTVPSAMSELLHTGGLPPSVRVVNLAGEPLATSLVQRLYQQPGLSRVYDLYGPSETTTYSTFTLRHPDKPATIGRPISGTQVYLLDSRLQPVPTGVPGEVFIAGAGVSRGYLGRPELTSERFIPDPFSSTPGARMYRTGDLARYRADGHLEYLGRTDFQVKVRGFRIELGEIETVLDKHPAVRQVVVVAREDRPGDKRLVAYLVPTTPASPELTPVELRAWLKQHLPEHMVPSAFVLLEQLPLTPNGKVNRKALPAPEAPTDSGTAYIAPRTPTEEKLAAIWAEVLAVPRVGAEDAFFELGGHSLLATRVISRVRSAFQVELPVRALFETPILSALAHRIDQVRGHQGGNEPSATPALKPASRTGAIPLAFAQQRLWFLDQLEPGTPVYNVPIALRLSGQLDTEALGRAFEELVRRHESLRTTFASHEGEPVQVIAPALSIPLEVVELQDVPAAERETLARKLAGQEAQRPFDLAHGPLLRTVLLCLAPDDHLLLVALHHIVSDGWSVGVLVREVASLYASFAEGQQPSLPPLPIQYADFALWQRSWLQGEVLDAQLGFWKQQLSGAPAHLELPTDKPRPPVQTFRGDNLPVALPKALSESLKSLSLRLGVTPFMTLLAGFQVLLHRYSGQDDISVGSPMAGRRGTELEGLIGFFVNTLVLRSRMAPKASFRELLQQVRDTTLAAYEHQELPFEKLVEQLQPQRDLSRSPFFQVMFILQNTPAEALKLPGLTLRPLPQSSGTAKFDWTLALTDTPDGFSGSLEYNVDLFERDTVARAMEHLRILLEAAVANPEARLSELPLLSEAEKHKLLVEWNDLPLDYPREATLHELFEAQVERTPHAEALVDGARSLTYAELNARANQLAHSLRELGVGPETPVGLCSKRSAELVVGLLGILKAGGLYVPLDPAYPRERLGFIVEDAQLRFLLAQSSTLDSLPEHSAHVLLLDKESESLSSASTLNPVRAASSSNLAYLIYTSGSTGRPKGVSIEHRNAVSFLFWARTVFKPEHLSGLLASTSIAFDLSVFELFLPLSLGGTVILANNALELPTLPAAQRVSLVNTVPSAMSELLRSGGLPSSVRVVNLAGEPLATSLVQQLYQQPGLSLVYDLYGPSETTTYSTFTLRHPDKPATIGRPISGTQVYLLDSRLQPVPTGVPGEVFIAGAGVSRGYLGRPELTAEKFLPDPFSAVPDARMYRTGDLARYRADGHLEYLGRTDFQVKVRGFRIELGEIETVLDKHPGVRQVVVVAREDRPGDKRLVAYLTASGQQAPTTAELRALLKQHLPEHMVPSTFVLLEQLPLTPNGKVNRKALPAPEAPTDSGTGYIAPRTPLEHQLASLWSEVLGVSRVGIRDHFFELGGHSLLATRLISRLNQAALGRNLGVLTLFQNPTVERLAEALGLGQDASESPRGRVKLRAGEPGQRPLFLVHGAGGDVMKFMTLASHLETARPLYALKDPALDGAEPLPASVEEMARHYVASIRELQPQGPYTLGGWSFGGVVALEMAQQLQAAGETVDLLTLIDTHAPETRAEPDELTLLGAFCQGLGLSWWKLPLEPERMTQLSGRERLAYVLEQAEAAAEGGPGIGLEETWRLYEAYLRHVRALSHYTPRPFAGRTVLFKASTQPEGGARDGRLGWSAWLTGALEVQEVPGTHHTLLTHPHAAALAERLTHLLNTLAEREAA